MPWRRSPFWFGWKVAIHTILYRAFPDSEGCAEYKSFMVYFAIEFRFIAQNQEVREVASILAIIRAKIARPVSKLQDNTLDFVLQRVAETDAIMEPLQQLHLSIQTSNSKSIPQAFGLYEIETWRHR
ncbi:hypothetical protein BDW68DRAFT_175134 [Aspergillus falconensis]